MEKLNPEARKLPLRTRVQRLGSEKLKIFAVLCSPFSAAGLFQPSRLPLCCLKDLKLLGCSVELPLLPELGLARQGMIELNQKGC